MQFEYVIDVKFTEKNSFWNSYKKNYTFYFFKLKNEQQQK